MPFNATGLKVQGSRVGTLEFAFGRIVIGCVKEEGGGVYWVLWAMYLVAKSTSVLELCVASWFDGERLSAAFSSFVDLRRSINYLTVRLLRGSNRASHKGNKAVAQSHLCLSR